MADRGTLIVVEGIDGAGKTTQAGRLGAALEAAGHRVVATREPTRGRFGTEIRRLAAGGSRAAPEEELRLFFEDRHEHVRDVIAPALAAGAVVVSDRYFLSTVAYQGARGLDPTEILARSEAAFPVPDLALLLEVEPEQGLARVRARGELVEAFERVDRLTAVAAVFRALDRAYLARVDGREAPDAVAARVAAVVRARTGLL